jgi:pantothenate kinase
MHKKRVYRIDICEPGGGAFQFYELEVRDFTQDETGIKVVTVTGDKYWFNITNVFMWSLLEEKVDG